MIGSQLQLDSYKLISIAVNAQPSTVFEDSDPVTKVNTTLEVSKQSASSRMYGVMLTVNLEGNGAYAGHVTFMGEFIVGEGIEAVECDAFATVNGAAILYSASREMLSNIFSRGPWQCPPLPAVTFIDCKDQKVVIRDEPDEETSS